MGKLSISMAMFHSHLKLPEGIPFFYWVCETHLLSGMHHQEMQSNGNSHDKSWNIETLVNIYPHNNDMFCKSIFPV